MSRRVNYVRPVGADYGRNPIRLTVEGIYLSPEHYDIMKEECEKFRQKLLDRFDGLDFEFPEEIFTSIETEKSIRGEC